jgi:hypothetical protein
MKELRLVLSLSSTHLWRRGPGRGGSPALLHAFMTHPWIDLF